MPDLKTLELISYVANVVFITWEVATFWSGRGKNRDDANFFNAAYEMAVRLAGSLKEQHAREQAEDIVSFLKASTRNLMNRKYDTVGGESHNFLIRWFARDKISDDQRKGIMSNKSKAK